MATESMTTNVFKRALASGKSQIGLWLTLDSLNSTEMVAGSGYDWLLLDMEHTCIESSHVVQHLRAAKGGCAEMVVRVPSLDAILLKRLLDGGVRSIMFPRIESAAEARAAVAATRYPPLGIRGVAGNTRANLFNRDAAYFDMYDKELCVIVQLESQAGFDAIAQIGAVEGVDGLFIGPNDLSASLGLLGKSTDPTVEAMIADGLARIRSTGKSAGILNFVPAQARALLRAGFGFIAVGSDGGIVARRSEALLAEIKTTPHV
jgi:4-hydroxy-2-oxoheptanedioate aldolase